MDETKLIYYFKLCLLKASFIDINYDICWNINTIVQTGVWHIIEYWVGDTFLEWDRMGLIYSRKFPTFRN
jgi:hypothetical protein